MNTSNPAKGRITLTLSNTIIDDLNVMAGFTRKSVSQVAEDLLRSSGLSSAIDGYLNKRRRDDSPNPASTAPSTTSEMPKVPQPSTTSPSRAALERIAFGASSPVPARVGEGDKGAEPEVVPDEEIPW